MPHNLIPSIEQRLSGLVEVTRRVQGEISSSKPKFKPTVTISREFGCEAYPMAEKLKSLLEKKTGSSWALMDKALLEEVAKNHNVSEEILKNLGTKPRFLDDIISTFSPNWKSDKDHYRILCRHIISLATAGNVIIVGRGGAVVTRTLENCYHFRLVAPGEYKVGSIAKRLGISLNEAQEMVLSRQQVRDKFVKDFLNRSLDDPTLYHMVFNNARSSTEKIADTIVHYMF
ncbi:cytidylate kinase [Geobacter sp. OR-1]|uniref:cytidylate kinase-like family protein n=1 Tax=Geobacter sp. OR-1 TaxID=1266765 RepID=UPI000541B70D|nr:cytidylate kinase-like family protein [Geobacter sp. OR-1]GAM08123.1 cytidylate kinase [Geobacter sp. OR-1]